MLANLQLNLKKPRPAKAVLRRYDVEKLTGRNDLVNDFEVKLGGAFAPLLDLDPEDVETMYDGFKEATNSTTERTVGFKRRKEVEGLQRSIEEACKPIRCARIEMVSLSTQRKEPFINHQIK